VTDIAPLLRGEVVRGSPASGPLPPADESNPLSLEPSRSEPTVDGLGPAVLASVIDALATGGRQIVDGQIETCRLGAGFALTPLPDGSRIGTTGAPTGELEAARRASGARHVVAATSEVPSGRITRTLLPLIGALVSVGPIRRALLAMVARFHLSPPASSKSDNSWAHAELVWADGSAARDGFGQARGTASRPQWQPRLPARSQTDRDVRALTPQRACSARLLPSAPVAN
jgi:hypothetical protein